MTRNFSGDARLAWAAVAGLAVLVSGAQAAAAPVSPATGRILSFEELKGCAEAALQLDGEHAELTGKRKELFARQAKAMADVAALVGEEPPPQSDDERLIAANARMDAVNREIVAHNAESQAVQARQVRQNTACTGAQIRLSDIARLPPELRRAAEKYSSGRQSAFPLSYEEMRACAERALVADASTAELKAQETELDRRKAAIDAQAAALEVEAPLVDTHKKREAEDFQARIDAHDAEVRAYNAAAVGWNARMSASNADTVDYAQTCALRGYREADMARLPPELQKVVRAKLFGGQPQK
jgi:hypothetical protein